LTAQSALLKQSRGISENETGVWFDYWERSVRADGRFERRVMAQALAALFGAGATLALVTVALPHSARASETGVLVIVAVAYVVAGALFCSAGSMPSWVLGAGVAAGITLITAVAYLSAQSPSPLVLFYLWVSLYCAYFFSRRQTAGQILYLGCAFALLLVLRPPPGGGAPWWLVGMGTLVVAAVMLGSLRERVESLIARLYDAARTDPLTELSNRRGFRELLDLELERTRRGARQMALIVGDLDHFKEVNDRSGRPVGDAALRRVARLMANRKRRIDGLARVADGQFALILPDTDSASALALAERLRGHVGEEFARDAVALTISFGIATSQEHATGAALVRAAEHALHAAKNSGRDRSVLYTPALGHAHPLNGHARDIRAERFLAVILDLAETVDLRFSGSARHSETVGRYAEMMARELGLPDDRVARVQLAGRLHDIGKVAVPDTILAKPDKLTDHEFAVIKRHPDLGAQILEHPSLADVRSWVAAHHERPDGRGYPLGLSANSLPIEARIIAVADAYEAMTSDRTYSPAIGHMAAQAELERCAGTQFDSRVVDAFKAVLDREAKHAHDTLAAAPIGELATPGAAEWHG
jgi:diguanylate cyclase (GGDEF)-like protein/putative nucleotidyltransferase with HDIG domain